MDDARSICDEFVGAEAEAKSNGKAKSNNEETKTVLTIFNEIIELVDQNISIFYLLLYELL